MKRTDKHSHRVPERLLLATATEHIQLGGRPVLGGRCHEEGPGCGAQKSAASPSNLAEEGLTAEVLGAAWTQGEPTGFVGWKSALLQTSTAEVVCVPEISPW